MAQEWLDNMLADACVQLLALGVPVSPHIRQGVEVNTRVQRRLGCCIFQEGAYTIQVSSRILDDLPLLWETLLHELLHTCPGCGNHGEKWKAHAQKVNQALGTRIQRTVKLDGAPQPLRREEDKYLLRCEDCGKEIRRMRMSKVVKAPWRYRCLCGGKLKRVR